MTLFMRDKKGVVADRGGRSLVQDGKKMAALAKNAEARAKRAEQEEGIVIRVGSSLLNPSKALTDLWGPLRAAYPQYKFHIVPYTDTKEERLAIIAALGEKFDLLVGAFDSKRILDPGELSDPGRLSSLCGRTERSPAWRQKKYSRSRTCTGSG